MGEGRFKERRMDKNMNGRRKVQIRKMDKNMNGMNKRKR